MLYNNVGSPPSPRATCCEELLNGDPINEDGAKRLLQRHGIAVPRRVVCDGAQDVARAMRSLGPNVAIKLLAAGLAHKSELGGVRLGIGTIGQAVSTADELRAIATRHEIAGARLLVEEMVPRGQEVVIGGVSESTFGPLVMLGLGGIFIEIFDDVAFRVCPIDACDAVDMIDELRAAPLLRGARGGTPVDGRALIDALLSVGGDGGLLMCHSDRIRELDINPLIVSADAAVAADAHVVLAGAPQ